MKTQRANKFFNIYLISFLISLFLVGLRLSFNQPISPDGVLYIKTANLFLNHGLNKNLFHSYSWPFYSILIAIVSKITALSLLHAAYFLNFLCDFLSVVIFIKLVKMLGGSVRIQWLAALVLLFFPLFSRMRLDVIRGHGYWAFALLGLWCFIKFVQNDQWKYALSWPIAMFIAFLFRIEGILYLAFLPVVVLTFHQKQKIKTLLKAYTLPLFGLFIVMFALWWIPSIHNLEYRSRLREIIYLATGKWASFLFHNLFHEIQLIRQTLPHYSQDYATTFTLFGLFGLYLNYLFYVLSAPYLILCFYGFRFINWSREKKILSWMIAINVSMIGLYIMRQFFLSHRYLYFLSLLLLLAIPFAIDRVYENWKQKKPGLTNKRWIFPVMIIGILYASLESVIYFGTSQTYLVDAGTWMSKNLATNQTLCVNNPAVAFYSQFPVSIENRQNKLSKQLETFLNPKTNCQIIALKIGHKHQDFLKTLETNPNLSIVKQFENKRLDQVVILDNVRIGKSN